MVRALEDMAPWFHVSVTAPNRLEANRSFQFQWSITCPLPLDTPSFIVVSIAADIRVELPLPSSSLTAYPYRPDAPGYIALPPVARGPFDLKYGAGHSRLIVPLHQFGSKSHGSAAVRLFEAGETDVKVALVSIHHGVESVIGEPIKRTLTVHPADPEVVILDPPDSIEPNDVIISNSARYRLNVLDGRYQVFDIPTGEKILDRAGREPTFSPTSRFAVARVGGYVDEDLEVVDLVSREVIARPFGFYIGFAEGDAYLIAGQASWGSLQVRPTLLSRPTLSWSGAGGGAGPTHDGLDLIGSGDCHACPSWNGNNHLTIDLDAGTIIFKGAQVITAYEMATGHTTSFETVDDLNNHIREYYKPSFAFEEGWNATPRIEFTHTLLSIKGSDWAAGAWYPPVVALEALLVKHQRQGRVRDRLTEESHSANLVSRGDWRPYTVSLPGRASALYDLQAPPFILAFARPDDCNEVPFSNSYCSEEGRRRSAFGGTQEEKREAQRIDARIRERSKALESQLLQAVPALRNEDVLAFEPNNGGPPRLSIDSALEGLWSWPLEGRAIYLVQLLSTQGSGAFGWGGLHLLKSEEGTHGKVRSLDDLMDSGFWGGEYGNSSSFNRLVVRLFARRYLVMASKAAHTIALFDIERDESVVIIKDIPQADLLSDVALTADATFVLQINSDGQFFFFEVATGQRVIDGHSVGGEIVLYTQAGYYWSSYEGAHFVSFRFPGFSNAFSFLQFAAHLERPDIVKGALAGHKATSTHLTPPPSVTQLGLTEESSSGGAQVELVASSYIGLSRIRLFLDGIPVVDQVVTGKQFRGVVNLPSVSSSRWITALAMDTRGFVSAPMGLRRPLVEVSDRRLYAVIAGVDTFDEPKLQLQFAASDARRVAAAIDSRAGLYYRECHITQLIDANATAPTIRQSLEHAVAHASSGDLILFSFAGHGIRTEQGFFVTSSGFRSTDPSNTGLAWSEIANVLGRARTRVFVVLDACHSAVAGSEGIASNEDVANELLSGTRAPIVLLAAARSRQSSWEGAKWGGGVFTHAFTRVVHNGQPLRSVARRAPIDMSELFIGVREIVHRATSGEQQPWLARRDQVGDFALL
jgi:hypothetical protein